MVEPMSVLGAFFGSFGFLVSLRSVVERVLLDIHRYKTGGAVLFLISTQLNLITIELENWQTFWHVQDGTPGVVFHTYWGAEGQELIMKLLCYVRQELAHMEGKLHNKYGKPFESHDDHELKHELNMNEIQAEFKRFLQAFNKRRGRLNQLGQALFEDQILRNHLENLRNAMDMLHETSEKQFKKYTKIPMPKYFEKKKDNIARKAFLIELANREISTCATFWKSVYDIEATHADFHIDYGVTPDQRQNRITQFVREKSMRYRLRILMQNASAPHCSFCIECYQTQCHSEGVVGNFRKALVELSGPSKSEEANIQTRSSTETVSFILEKQSSNLPQPTSLRTFLAFCDSPFETSLHGEFTKPERTKLAYELAECIFLFLKTRFWNRLCSCCVYRFADRTNSSANFTVRISKLSHVDHIDPKSGELHQNKQWCEEQLFSKPIERLGVLLTEIAIGKPVLDAVLHQQHRDIEIDITDKHQIVQELGSKQISAQICQRGDWALARAIEYCFTSRDHPVNITPELLEGFYDNVLVPLHKHYQKEVIDVRLRRASIYH